MGAGRTRTEASAACTPHPVGHRPAWPSQQSGRHGLATPCSVPVTNQQPAPGAPQQRLGQTHSPVLLPQWQGRSRSHWALPRGGFPMSQGHVPGAGGRWAEKAGKGSPVRSLLAPRPFRVGGGNSTLSHRDCEPAHLLRVSTARAWPPQRREGHRAVAPGWCHTVRPAGGLWGAGGGPFSQLPTLLCPSVPEQSPGPGVPGSRDPVLTRDTQLTLPPAARFRQ